MKAMQFMSLFKSILLTSLEMKPGSEMRTATGALAPSVYRTLLNKLTPAGSY